MTYEEILIEAEYQGVDITEYNFKGTCKGLYCDNCIFISSELNNESEKKSILYEELGHHFTSYSNILNQDSIVNRKQEKKARNWGYDKACGIMELIAAYKYGCKNRFEIAEYLNLTEEFIDESIKHLKEKYGVCVRMDNYVVYFEPSLGIVKKF